MMAGLAGAAAGTAASPPPVPVNPAAAASSPRDNWDYLILTTAALEEAFAPLASAARIPSPMTGHVLTLDVDCMPPVTTVAGVRALIQDAVANHGTKYVLLGGDVTHVPVPLFWMPGARIGSDEDVAVPADIYYSCLDGTWNSDGDDRLGEETDGADFLPDVAVGRILAGTPGEAQYQVTKILAYEGAAAPPFSALQVGDRFYYDLCGGNFLDQLPTVMALVDVATLYDRDGWWASSLLLEDYLNTNTVHLVNHLGSGFWNYALKLWSVELPSGLTNTTPFFLYSQADSAGDFNHEDSWGQQITTGSSHGAFAAVLHSGPTWNLLPGGDSASNDLHRAFLRAVFHRFQPVDSAPSRTHTLGEAMMAVRAEWAGAMTDWYYRWSNCGLNLLGCPFTTLHWGCSLTGVHLAPDSPAEDTFILRKDSPALLRVAFHTACGHPVSAGVLTVSTGSGRDLVQLHDDGVSPDTVASDGLFSAYWTPTSEGVMTLTFNGEAGIETDELVLSGTVLPNLHYYVRQVPFEWEDAGDGTLVLEGMDDETWTLDLGFDFPFYGKNYDTVTVSSNGVLFFEQPPLSSAEPVSLPSFRLPQALIACFWTDLWAPSGSGVRYKTVGTAPDRRYIIQWDRYSIWGITTTGTFQAVLEEGSGKIWLNYLDTVFNEPAMDYGRSATFGVENQEGAEGCRNPLENIDRSTLDSHVSFLLWPGEPPAYPVVATTRWLSVPARPKIPLEEQEAILDVELLNVGIQPAHDLSGVLTAGAGVTILDGTATFRAVEPGGRARAGFRVRFSDGLACEDGINYQLQLTYSDALDQTWTHTEPLLLDARSLVPVLTLAHNAQSGDGGFTTATPAGTANWQRVEGPAYSPTWAWHVEGEDGVQDAQLISPEVTLPDQAVLTFYHRYDFEPGYDGGVLEIRRQGETGWTDLDPDIVRGSYTGSIAVGYNNPIAGQLAWTGTTDSEFVPVQVNLVRFAGDTVHFRFRYAGDETTASGGWSVDDIGISGTTRACLVRPLGDVNFSPGIDATDLAWLMSASVGNVPLDMTGGDLNGNAAWDAGDVMILADYLAGNVAFWTPDNL